MAYFDFHHHKINISEGILNLDIFDSAPKHLYSIGIHPKDIDENNHQHQLEWLRNNISEHCFAIGECGLDSLVSTNQEIQSRVFLENIKIAEEFKKPLIIHCVRKFSELISFKKKTNQAMIVHGFNKKQSIAESLLLNNFYLSFGKAVLYNLSLQNTLKDTPLNRIFLETDDAEFDIAELYFKTAELKNITVENLQNQILTNLDTIKNG